MTCRWAARSRPYSILTVGDGLVSQIPAVIIAIASALLLARGGSTGATEHRAACRNWVGTPQRSPRWPSCWRSSRWCRALPFLPFVLGAAALGLAAYLRTRQRQAEADSAALPAASPEPARERVGDLLDIDDIHVEFAPDLVGLALDPGTGLDARIRNMREHIARAFGVLLPEMRLTDRADLEPGTYAIRLLGVEHGRAALRPGQLLVLKGDAAEALPRGDDVEEPVYGAPARWIDPSAREDAALSGLTIVTPSEVLATHLLEVLKRNLDRLLTFKTLQRQLDAFVTLSDSARAEENRRLLDELVPDKVPLDLLHSVLRLLLSEQVSIRNLPLILEAIAEMARRRQPAGGDLRTRAPAPRLSADRGIAPQRRHPAARPALGRVGGYLPEEPDRRRRWPAGGRPAPRSVSTASPEACPNRSPRPARGAAIRRWSRPRSGGASYAWSCRRAASRTRCSPSRKSDWTRSPRSWVLPHRDGPVRASPVRGSGLARHLRRRVPARRRLFFSSFRDWVSR